MSGPISDLVCAFSGPLTALGFPGSISGLDLHGWLTNFNLTSGWVAFLIEITVLALALTLTGASIKLMDDTMDAELDRERNQPNWSASLGPAAVPYALFLLVVGTALAPRESAAIFLATYGVGMAGEFRRRMPTGLKGYEESLVALLAGVVLLGPRLMLWAASLMLSAQLADDLLDLKEDRDAGFSNLAAALGSWESGLAAAGLWLVSLLLEPVKTVVAVIPLRAFVFVPVVLRRKREKSRRERTSAARIWNTTPANACHDREANGMSNMDVAE